jgi:hypothetical protein
MSDFELLRAVDLVVAEVERLRDGGGGGCDGRVPASAASVQERPQGIRRAGDARVSAAAVPALPERGFRGFRILFLFVVPRGSRRLDRLELLARAQRRLSSTRGRRMLVVGRETQT